MVKKRRNHNRTPRPGKRALAFLLAAVLMAAPAAGHISAQAQEEHTHSEACYDAAGVLNCDQEAKTPNEGEGSGKETDPNKTSNSETDPNTTEQKESGETQSTTKASVGNAAGQGESTEGLLKALESTGVSKERLLTAGAKIVSAEAIPTDDFVFQHPPINGTQHDPYDLNDLAKAKLGNNQIQAGNLEEQLKAVGLNQLIVDQQPDEQHSTKYTYVCAHVGDVRVYYAGRLQIGSETYTYYVTDETLDSMTVYSVLTGDQKITVDYTNENTHTVTYEFVDWDHQQPTFVDTNTNGQKDDGEDWTTPGDWTLDQIYGADRPVEIIHGRAGKLNVKIPRGYEVQVAIFRDTNNDGIFDKDDDTTIAHKAELGEMLSYRKDPNDYNKVVLEENSAEKTIYETQFTSDAVNCNVLVSMKWRKIGEFRFRAGWWEATNRAKGRIEPWGSEKNTDLPTAKYNCSFGKDWTSENGATHTWHFTGLTSVPQTRVNDEWINDGTDKYTWELDQLAVNGEPIEVPMVPISPGNPNGTTQQLPSKTTTLSTGTKVTVTMTKWNGESGTTAWRNYEVKFENCYENITISGGNMLSHTHREIVIDKLSGVSSPEYWHFNGGKAQWSELHLNTLIARTAKDANDTKSGYFSDPIRFKKKIGYGVPATVTVTKKDGTELQKNGVYKNSLGNEGASAECIEYLVLDETKASDVNGTLKPLNGQIRFTGNGDCFKVVNYANWTPSKGGYYYFREKQVLDTLRKTGNENAVLVSIESTPVKGAVRYTNGADETGNTAPKAADIDNVPVLDEGPDKQGYDCEVNNLVEASSQIPRDKTGEFEFQHWEVVTVKNGQQPSGTTADSAMTVDGEETPVVYEQGEKVHVTNELQEQLANCFYKDADKDRYVITLRAVWKKTGLKSPIKYNVYYYVDNSESPDQPIASKSHMVPAGATIMTDLYKDENAKVLSDSIQSVLKGDNKYNKDFGTDYLVGTNTTMKIETVDLSAPAKYNAYIYLISKNMDVNVEKVWSGDAEVNRPTSVDVQLQRKLKSEDDTAWDAVKDNGTNVEATLNQGNEWKHTFKVPRFQNDNTNEPYVYRVAELNDQRQAVGPGAYLLTNPGTGNGIYQASYNMDPQDLKTDVTITNTYMGSVPDLTLTKKVSGSASKESMQKEYAFTIKLEGLGDKDPTEIKYIFGNDPENEERAFDADGDGGAKAEIRLMPYDYVVIKDLPDGVTYTITETTESYFDVAAGISKRGTSQGVDLQFDNLTLRMTDSGEDGKSDWTTEKNSDQPAIVAFTNTRETGNVTIKKEVAGDGGNKEEVWDFAVTLDDSAVTGVYGDIMFVRGMANFVLKDGESVTLTLPEGVEYNIYENRANRQGYITSYKVGDQEMTPYTDKITGVVEAGNDTNITVENYRPPILSVPIEGVSKTLDDKTPGADDSFQFVLMQGEDEIQTVTNTGANVSFEPLTFYRVGTYEYTLREVAGDNDKLVYDDSEYTFVVTVTLNSEKREFEYTTQWMKGDKELDKAPTFENTTKTDPVNPDDSDDPNDPDDPNGEDHGNGSTGGNSSGGNQSGTGGNSSGGNGSGSGVSGNGGASGHAGASGLTQGVVKTGDESNAMLWAALLVIALAGMTTVIAKKKRK